MPIAKRRERNARNAWSARSLRAAARVAAWTLAAMLVTGRAGALSATSVAPGYSAAAFPAMPVATNALAFKGVGEAYVSPPAMGSTFTVDVVPGPGYGTATRVFTYSGSGSLGPALAVTGLDFSAAGNLYACEILPSENAGYIREVASGTELLALPGFRPTGIAVVNDGTFVFTGRQLSNPSFGGVYMGTRTGSFVQTIPNIIGRGVAISPGGDVYVSTPQSPVSAGYAGSSIYKFPGGAGPGQWVATFDANGPAELTFDQSGKLYALGDATGGVTPVVVLTVAVAAAPGLPVAGVALLAGLLAAAGLVLARGDRLLAPPWPSPQKVPPIRRPPPRAPT
jgi:hypothetical protein